MPNLAVDKHSNNKDIPISSPNPGISVSGISSPLLLVFTSHLHLDNVYEYSKQNTKFSPSRLPLQSSSRTARKKHSDMF